MSPSTVLIVSAEPISRDLYVRTLSGTGEIYTASAGSEALERMRHAPADLVITAETLPDMSAPDLCRLIKTEMAQANPQVILLSSNGNGECDSADASFDTRAELSNLHSLASALLRARAAEERVATMQDRANQFFATVRGGSFELDRGGASSPTAARLPRQSPGVQSGAPESFSGMRSPKSGTPSTRRSTDASWTSGGPCASTPRRFSILSNGSR